MKKKEKLKSLLEKEEILLAPGVYDGISASLVNSMNFKVAYMTGSGTSAGAIGKPDLGLATMTEMVENATRIVNCLDIPLIADADTGYGGVINVVRTVSLYEQAGVDAIHIEDQDFPKKCGHLEGKRLIPPEEFGKKIEAAVQERNSPNFLIIARTDARAVNGLDDAIYRAQIAKEAGADIIFVESPYSRKEIEEITKKVEGPLLINMASGGKTPDMSKNELIELGYKIAIYPGLTVYPAIMAIRRTLKKFIELETEKNLYDEEFSPKKLFETVGLNKWIQIEKKYSNG